MAQRTHARAEGRPSATRVDLDEGTRRTLVATLNARLADSLDLYSQCKQAHWNVRGTDFWQLHRLFDELAELVEHHADTLAERATALGGAAEGTARQVASATALPEFPASPGGIEYVEALGESFGAYARGLREGIEEATEDDPATADVFTQVLRDAEKGLYFLEAHRARSR